MLRLKQNSRGEGGGERGGERERDCSESDIAKVSRKTLTAKPKVHFNSSNLMQLTSSQKLFLSWLL